MAITTENELTELHMRWAKINRCKNYCPSEELSDFGHLVEACHADLDLTELYEWCCDNCEGYFAGNSKSFMDDKRGLVIMTKIECFKFELESDAMAFKLAWSEFVWSENV